VNEQKAMRTAAVNVMVMMDLKEVAVMRSLEADHHQKKLWMTEREVVASRY
jgi:hypothetical protein